MAGNISAIKFVKVGMYVIPVTDIQWVAAPPGQGGIVIKMKNGDASELIDGVDLDTVKAVLDNIYDEARVEQVKPIEPKIASGGIN